MVIIEDEVHRKGTLLFTQHRREGVPIIRLGIRWKSWEFNFQTTMSRSGATQAKDRLYAQLASSLKNMSRAIGQTADLMEHLQNDLDAMRVLAGTHAAQCVAVFRISCFQRRSDCPGS